jgi:hypothetical protein
VNTYEVELTCTTTMSVDVEAETEDDARAKAKAASENQYEIADDIAFTVTVGGATLIPERNLL